MRKKEYIDGMRLGMPICIGYFFVSFGFGAMAVAEGLKWWIATLISATNLTSAGQSAGLTVITEVGAEVAAILGQLVLTQLVINSRYGLMSLALGQKFGPSVGTGARLVCAFFNTDEVFALGMSRQGKLTPWFFLGAGTVAAIGWITGTVSGALAGSLLPESIRAVLGVMLYGMFIAIVVPQAREEKPILFNVLLALVLSCLFAWIPFLKDRVDAGLVIVICTVVAAAVTSLVFPIKEDAE